MEKRLQLMFVMLLALPLCLFAQSAKQEQIAQGRNLHATGQPMANLIRGPYLQVVTSNSIVVRWRTDTWARSRVRYGSKPGNLNLVADDSSLVTEHEVKLTGLTPRTRYYYSIGGIMDTLQGDKDNYFVTLPVPGTEGMYRIGVFGDCGNNSTNQRSVRDE